MVRGQRGCLTQGIKTDDVLSGPGGPGRPLSRGWNSQTPQARAQRPQPEGPSRVPETSQALAWSFPMV